MSYHLLRFHTPDKAFCGYAVMEDIDYDTYLENVDFAQRSLSWNDYEEQFGYIEYETQFDTRLYRKNGDIEEDGVMLNEVTDLKIKLDELPKSLEEIMVVGNRKFRLINERNLMDIMSILRKED